jgi:serine/threonine protein kinase
MDYIDGENLNDYLKHHKMSEKEATDTISEVAKALQYMHEEKHMLHLDLKPGNIMRRNSDGHIFLIDFGLSKHYSENGVPETSTSVGLGTPGYAPIEQANSKNAKQFRATLDVYALGATFYKLLTGQTPPSADELVSDEELINDELAKLDISNESKMTIEHSMMPSVKHRTKDIKGFLADLYPEEHIITSKNDNPHDDEVTVIAEVISQIKEKESETKDIIVEEAKKDVPQKNEPKGVEVSNTGSNLENILKYYIPSVLLLCFIIVLINLHSNYSYGYWWVDEEYVIGYAIAIFIAIMLIYYLLYLRSKLNGNK